MLDTFVWSTVNSHERTETVPAFASTARVFKLCSEECSMEGRTVTATLLSVSVPVDSMLTPSYSLAPSHTMEPFCPPADVPPSTVRFALSSTFTPTVLSLSMVSL